MLKKLKRRIQRLCCHKNVYGGLSACHGFAAYATGKPEVYVPMALLYFVLMVAQ